MITELSISGLGVIDDAVLEPHRGLTAVTGETGAGKTMVVTALGLITGSRADAGRVRAGTDRAVVTARMEASSDPGIVEQVAAVGGRPDEDGSLILVRSVGADGRSRTHIGGRAAPLGALTDLTSSLVTVHGQADAGRLAEPVRQRALLDRFAHNESVLATYRHARADWLAARVELVDRQFRGRERAQREQLLTLGLAEIDRVAPRPGEDTELLIEVLRLENADSLRQAAESARGALSGDGGPDVAGAVALVETARKLLAGTGDPTLAEWAGRLPEVSAVLSDTAVELSAYLNGLDADPGRLESLMERQAALRALTRRYGADVDAVLAWRVEAATELTGLDSSAEVVSELTERCRVLGEQVATAAAELSDRRRRAAADLGGQVTGELAELALPQAVFRVAVEDRVTARETHDAGVKDATPTPDTVLVGDRRLVAGVDGVDQVEFRLTAHPSAPELPVARGASGGELSRVMLALEVVLAGADPVATLVFDEVDAGVGGRAATEIGRRLARLARTHQVVVVTHLAQVAAFADRQVVVRSDVDGAVRAASLQVLDDRQRQAELARMLGGTDGPTARAHAGELLAAATADRTPRRSGSQTGARTGSQTRAPTGSRTGSRTGSPTGVRTGRRRREPE